jgi:hypothetical protein
MKSSKFIFQTGLARWLGVLTGSLIDRKTAANDSDSGAGTRPLPRTLGLVLVSLQ